MEAKGEYQGDRARLASDLRWGLPEWQSTTLSEHSATREAGPRSAQLLTRVQPRARTVLPATRREPDKMTHPTQRSLEERLRSKRFS